MQGIPTFPGQYIHLAVVFCRTSGIIGSVLGLAGPVSVYCDWVRYHVSSTASSSHSTVQADVIPVTDFAYCSNVQ